MRCEPPYLLFLGSAADPLAAKTASGVLAWRPEWCLGQLRLEGCRADLGLPDLSVSAAAAAGARTLLIGVANAGGTLPAAWTDVLTGAVAAGLDVASGLHARLAEIPGLAAAAERHGRRLIDVRHPDRSFEVGSGTPRPGRRLLTVGTDCSVGKMYTALALERELRARNISADFRATGQTGIFIAGDGVAVDAVVADFISGAAEWVSPANAPDHWDLVEGQGSLFHPSFAGVSLGLLHGAQAEALVLCHEPTRTHMRGLPDRPLPDLRACLEANEAAAQLTCPGARCVALAINTSGLAADARSAYLGRLADRFGLPVEDPLVTGVAAIADRLVA